MKPNDYSFRAVSWLVLSGLAIATAEAAEPSPAFRAPRGFRVVEFAGDDLVHDAFSLTHDKDGRAVVSGPGYVRRLDDVDGDGCADRSTTIWAGPASGAQGLCFVEHDLWYTGDGGLWRVADANRDGAFDGPPTRIAELANPEHGAHQIVQGPDGWLYVVCGNDAGVGPGHVRSERPPIAKPQSGAVLRFSRDGQHCEIVADGFRNPYDLAFAADGRLFTVDSDGERDQYLPWYAPTRVFDVVVGARHGWVSGGWTKSWSQPASWFDNAPRLAELGRGSPTGAVVYRHTTFPERYLGGLFTACWTLGRVYFLPLTGATPSNAEVFLETTGQAGFAPVDLEVGPEGDLWMAIGGRGTRGGVFRVRPETIQDIVEPQDDIARVLDAPQPLSAWSRDRWLPLARKQGAAVFTTAALDRRRSAEQRVRAIEILTECWDGLAQGDAERVAADEEPAVAARLAWSLGRSAMNSWKRELAAQLTGAPSPSVQRAAWEALAQVPRVEAEPVRPDWSTAFASEDRSVRQAMLAAAQGASHDQRPVAPEQVNLPARLRSAEISALTGRPLSPAECLSLAREVFADPSRTSMRPEAARLLQMALGDVWTGVSADDRDAPAAAQESRPAGYGAAKSIAAPAGLAEWLVEVFPTDDEALDQELARIASQVGLDHAAFVDRLTEKWTTDSAPDADLHYLFVAAELPSITSETAPTRIAAAIACLHDKMRARDWRASRNWPEHVAELVARLIARDPRIAPALAARKELVWPEQAVYGLALTGEPRETVARRLIPALVTAEQPAPREAWELLAELPLDEVRGALTAQAERFGVTSMILGRLAAAPTAGDRRYFLEGLSALDSAVVVQAADALARDAALAADGEVADAVAAIRRWSQPPLGRDGAAKPLGESERKACRALSALLAHWTGQGELDRACRAGGYQPAACAVWSDWFATTEAGRRAVRKESRHWEDVAWSNGDVLRGRDVFARSACVRCHEGDSRLGPDLRGAAKRLSRDDLLTAIVDPQREVSPTYRLTQYETTDGRVFRGQVVYESPEATLVQIDGENSIRLRADEIARETECQQSLMPEGLLDRLDDASVADLMAYLASLGTGP